MANEQDFVDLGLSCSDVCKALEKGMDGKSLGDLNKSVRDAINQLMTWVEPVIHISCPSAYHGLDRRTVEEIQGRVSKRNERVGISRIVHSKNDKDVIAGLKLDLARILHVFNVRSVRSCVDVANYSVPRRSWL